MMSNLRLRALLADIDKKYQNLANAVVALSEGSDGRELLKVLSTYQNEDGGFGHGLEGDIQMPHSNVASTNMAVNLLEHVTHPDKEKMMFDIIDYYQDVYDAKNMEFHMVPKEVDDYPHAVWWNYDSLDSFTFGNPNPEIAGTLYRYQDRLNRMDFDAFFTKVIEYIKTDMKNTVSMHSLMSTLSMYERLDQSYQDELHELLQEYVDQIVEDDPIKWPEYSLEPYKVYLVAPRFIKGHETSLNINLEQLEKQLENGPIRPNWSWFQYMDVFEQVKDHWTVFLTFDVVRAIKSYRKQ